jgi:hypothetical protein
MFCPSCGTEYTIGLPYCNRCGANLGGSVTETTETASFNMTNAIATVGTTIMVLTLGGFISLIVGASKLADRPAMGSQPIGVLLTFGIITILVVDIFLARQLSRLIDAGISGKKSPKRTKATAAAMPELARPITSPLPPQLSVTENTTRFLEPEYRAPSQSKEQTPVK